MENKDQQCSYILQQKCFMRIRTIYINLLRCFLHYYVQRNMPYDYFFSHINHLTTFNFPEGEVQPLTRLSFQFTNFMNTFRKYMLWLCFYLCFHLAILFDYTIVLYCWCLSMYQSFWLLIMHMVVLYAYNLCYSNGEVDYIDAVNMRDAVKSCNWKCNLFWLMDIW